MDQKTTKTGKRRVKKPVKAPPIQKEESDTALRDADMDARYVWL